ncbi:hypothetical protein DMN91_009205 [Ooceraea biroi]|uniref:RNA-directed DNA polymerase n=1 Tax=Ooceraea biroi TaxID=2015173 RepID=A0A3L8DEE3_OOCBI|nr:hypothetical protein DMN91_009205 [Ooceraea biroi]
MIASLLRAHHDNMAHAGAEKTLAGIRRSFWFPTMRKKVYEYIENCLTCLMVNTSTQGTEGETQLYPLPKEPLKILHIDHFGPLQGSADNYKHILVIIDAFTRFTWLSPTKSTGTTEVICCLDKLFNTFGRPKEIVSDRGTAFTSKEFKDFVLKFLVKHRLIAVASLWANGIAERINRYLKSALTKLIDTPDGWKDRLGEMQYIVNNTYHSSIKSSPAKLLLGFEQRNHEDHSFAQFTRMLVNVDSNLEKERKISRDAANQATELIRNYNKKYHDENRKKPSQYNVGDYVLIRDMRSKIGESSKLKPKYRGPYQITKCLGNNRYVVRDIPGFNHTPKPLDTILSSV